MTQPFFLFLRLPIRLRGSLTLLGNEIHQQRLFIHHLVSLEILECLQISALDVIGDSTNHRVNIAVDFKTLSTYLIVIAPINPLHPAALP